MSAQGLPADYAPRHIADMSRGDWEPQFSPWRHGGWYVDNVAYASGAVGCVSRNYEDRKWRIVCDDRRDQPTYPSRIAAASAERFLALASFEATK